MDKILKYSINYNIIYNKKVNTHKFNYYLNSFKNNISIHNFLYNKI